MSNYLPFAEFQTRLLRLYTPPIRAKSTWYAMRRALREFVERTGINTTADFRTDCVALYVSSRSRENVNTTISRLRCLRTASFFAKDEGWMDRVPQWSRLFPRSAPPCVRRHYGYDEVKELLRCLAEETRAGEWKAHRLFAVTALVAYTGLRKLEALRMHVDDLDVVRGVAFVVPRHRLKTESSAAPIPLPPELLPILRGWLPRAGTPWLFPGVTKVGPWTGGAPGYRALDELRKVGERVGLSEVTWHGLRHTLGKLMIHRFGLTRDQAKSVLRHSDVRTTEDFYLHRDDLDSLRMIGRSISFRPGDAA